MDPKEDEGREKKDTVPFLHMFLNQFWNVTSLLLDLSLRGGNVVVDTLRHIGPSLFEVKEQPAVVTQATLPDQNIDGSRSVFPTENTDSLQSSPNQTLPDDPGETTSPFPVPSPKQSVPEPDFVEEPLQANYGNLFASIVDSGEESADDFEEDKLEAIEEEGVRGEVAAEDAFSDKERRLRQIVAKEIVDTETSYLESLTFVHQVWMPALQPVLNAQDFKNLFSSIDIIKAYNQNLLEELRLRLENWSDEQCIGDVFLLPLTDFFKVYVGYTNGFTNARAVISRNMKSSSFRKAVNKIVDDPQGKGLDLVSYLIMPVQRIPRYELLLRELGKHTPAWHADTAHIAQALAKMKGVSECINTQQKEYEAIVRVTEIAGLLGKSKDGFDLMQPTRRYIAECPVLITVPGDPKAHTRTMFVFNDLLLFAKTKSKDRLKIDRYFEMSTVVVPQKIGSPVFARRLSASLPHAPGEGLCLGEGAVQSTTSEAVRRRRRRSSASNSSTVPELQGKKEENEEEEKSVEMGEAGSVGVAVDNSDVQGDRSWFWMQIRHKLRKWKQDHNAKPEDESRGDYLCILCPDSAAANRVKAAVKEAKEYMAQTL